MRFIKALKKEDERRALMATLLFIILMVLFFLLASMEIPDPPLEEKIIEIEMEFGSDYKGGSSNDAQAEEQQSEPKPVTESAKHYDTQDDSPVVVTSGKGSSSKSTNTSEPDPVPTKPKVDDAFDFGKTGGTTGGSGDGDDFGKGAGVGDGGKGNNPGGGEGTTNLSRKLKSKGKISGDSQETGDVAFDVYVNEAGKVVESRLRINEAQTTTGDAYLINLAKKNIMTYQYQAMPGTGIQHVGVVVIPFRKK